MEEEKWKGRELVRGFHPGGIGALISNIPAQDSQENNCLVCTEALAAKRACSRTCFAAVIPSPYPFGSRFLAALNTARMTPWVRCDAGAIPNLVMSTWLSEETQENRTGTCFPAHPLGHPLLPFRICFPGLGVRENCSQRSLLEFEAAMGPK